MSAIPISQTISGDHLLFFPGVHISIALSKANQSIFDIDS